MWLEIEARGTDRVGTRFAQLERALRNPRPALEQAADYLRQREQRRFLTQGDGSWQPLADQTVKRKGNARILIDSGKAMRSLTVKGAPGSVARITGATLRFGTSVYYMRFQANRRPLFDITATDRRQIAGRVAHVLMEAFD